MQLYYLSVSLAVLANLFYHLIQKSTPQSVPPLLSLSITYFVALMASLALLPFFLTKPIKESLQHVNWTSFALGLAIIGLELGSLLAYRAGWNISFYAIFSNVLVTLILIPVGMLLFKESLSLLNITGIVLCIGGLILINMR